MWQSCTGSGTVEKARKIVLAFPASYAKLLQGLAKMTVAYRRGSSMGWGEGRVSVSRFPPRAHRAAVGSTAGRMLPAALRHGHRNRRGRACATGTPPWMWSRSTRGEYLRSPLAVQIRNDLLFNFTGGGDSYSPTHQLKVQSLAGGRSCRSTGHGAAERRILQLRGDLFLDRDCDRKGRGHRPGDHHVSYDTLGQQRFARLRGMHDAEVRAAKVITDNITSRLASYFVSGS